MSVSVHEAFSLDSAQDRYWWMDHFLGDQLQDEWSEGGTGSAAVVDAQTGGIVRLTTGATTANEYHIQWGENPNEVRSLHINKKVTIEVRAKLTQINAVAIYINLYFNATNRVRFWYDSTVDPNWLISNSNVATTTSNSGVAADTDYHVFRIECFPTDEVHYYIDDVECANSPITLSIPDDAGDYLMPRISLVTNEDVVKTADVDYVACRQDR